MIEENHAILASINKRLASQEAILEEMRQGFAVLAARMKPQGEYDLENVHRQTGDSVYTLEKHCRLGTLAGAYKRNRKWYLPQPTVDNLLTYGLPTLKQVSE